MTTTNRIQKLSHPATGRAKRDSSSETIVTVRLAKDLVERIDAIADVEERSRTRTVAMLLKRAIQVRETTDAAITSAATRAA